MDWIHPWIGLDCVGPDWVTIFIVIFGLHWIGGVTVTFFEKLVSIGAQLTLFLSNCDL